MSLSENCYNDILMLVEEYINESNRARKYGQEKTNVGSKLVDKVGTRAIKDAIEMNPEGEYSKERHITLHLPKTQKALKNKKAIQGAIKSLQQADSYKIEYPLSDLKHQARELSRRYNPEYHNDILDDNGTDHSVKSNYERIVRSLKDNNGYKKLEQETKKNK